MATPSALSTALRRLLTDRTFEVTDGREAQRLADGWYWPTIGQRFGTMMSAMAEGGQFAPSRTATGGDPCRRINGAPPQVILPTLNPAANRTALPEPEFGHLRKLTDEKGVWEHARILTPRTEHGFCTDDNARALLVVCRQPSPPDDLEDLAAIYLRFVLEARTDSGHFHNRRDAAGVWIDDVGSDDSQGRAWWGLGTVARLGPTASMRRAGADAFATCASFDSPHLRANAYAALGAVEMLVGQSGSRRCRPASPTCLGTHRRRRPRTDPLAGRPPQLRQCSPAGGTVGGGRMAR